MRRCDELPPRRRGGSRASSRAARAGGACHSRAQRSANPRFDLAGVGRAGAGTRSRPGSGRWRGDLRRQRLAQNGVHRENHGCLAVHDYEFAGRFLRASVAAPVRETPSSPDWRRRPTRAGSSFVVVRTKMISNLRTGRSAQSPPPDSVSTLSAAMRVQCSPDSQESDPPGAPPGYDRPACETRCADIAVPRGKGLSSI